MVDEKHDADDLDADDYSAHHTLGPRKGQASPGTHQHDGKDSIPVLNGLTIAGSIASGAALKALIVALGGTDATTP